MVVEVPRRVPPRDPVEWALTRRPGRRTVRCGYQIGAAAAVSCPVLVGAGAIPIAGVAVPVAARAGGGGLLGALVALATPLLQFLLGVLLALLAPAGPPGDLIWPGAALVSQPRRRGPHLPRWLGRGLRGVRRRSGGSVEAEHALQADRVPLAPCGDFLAGALLLAGLAFVPHRAVPTR